MKYEKPNIALVASAVGAVKSDQIKDDAVADSQTLASTSAYESDE